jgi:AraC-like DNA-binding protein
MSAPIIPAYIAIALVEWAKIYAIKPTKLAEVLSFSVIDELYAEDCRLSAQQYERLLAYLYQHSERPDLGLLFAQQLTLASYGVLGHAMLSAATVGQAIDMGLSYYRLTSSFMTLSSTQSAHTLHIRAVLDYPLPALSQFAPEELIIGWTKIARQLMGEDFSPLCVSFRGPQPPYHVALVEYLRCPIKYLQDACLFEIDSSVLSLPLKTANALTAKQLLNLCQQLLNQEPVIVADDIVVQVQQLIKAKANYWPSMQQVADLLAMSERTLRRRLQAQGTDYQQQIDQVRQQLAKQLISNKQVTVQQAAAVLGYSEPASFRRAFYRWMGVSPQAFRLANQN